PPSFRDVDPAPPSRAPKRRQSNWPAASPAAPSFVLLADSPGFRGSVPETEGWSLATAHKWLNRRSPAAGFPTRRALPCPPTFWPGLHGTTRVVRRRGGL